MTRKNRYPDRKPVVVPLSVDIQANRDHIVMVIPFDAGLIPPGFHGTIGLRFLSVEHLLEVVTELMEAAKKTWPDDPWIQAYRKDE